jgi:hypothetical protein
MSGKRGDEAQGVHEFEMKFGTKADGTPQVNSKLGFSTQIGVVSIASSHCSGYSC